MELRHLRYFEAVASELSFSRAAERLHIAQSALSRQIRQLEDELGAQLLDRRARPLQLTAAGRYFFEQVVQLLDRARSACELTRRISEGERDWFGIGFVPSTLYGLLPNVVRKFRAGYPALEISLSELTSIQQGDALKARRIDVGFGRLLLNDSQLGCEVILEERLVVAVPTGHPLLSARRISLLNIALEPLLLYPARPRPSYADVVLAIFRRYNLQPKIALEANELHTVIGLVAAGVGIALVPESVRRLHREDVVYRPILEQGIVSPVIMNFRLDDASKHLTYFRSLIKEKKDLR